MVLCVLACLLQTQPPPELQCAPHIVKIKLAVRKRAERSSMDLQIPAMKRRSDSALAHQVCCDASWPDQRASIARRSSTLTSTGSLKITPYAVQRSSGTFKQKEAATRACCNAMLSAYAHATPAQASRAMYLLQGMQRCARGRCCRLCRCEWVSAVIASSRPEQACMLLI